MVLGAACKINKTGPELPFFEEFIEGVEERRTKIIEDIMREKQLKKIIS